MGADCRNELVPELRSTVQNPWASHTSCRRHWVSPVTSRSLSTRDPALCGGRRTRVHAGRRWAWCCHGRCEFLDGHQWRTQAGLARAMFHWIEAFYNPDRRHSTLSYLSPIDYEATTATAVVDTAREEIRAGWQFYLGRGDATRLGACPRRRTRHGAARSVGRGAIATGTFSTVASGVDRALVSPYRSRHGRAHLRPRRAARRIRRPGRSHQRRVTRQRAGLVTRTRAGGPRAGIGGAGSFIPTPEHGGAAVWATRRGSPRSHLSYALLAVPRGFEW